MVLQQPAGFYSYSLREVKTIQYIRIGLQFLPRHRGVEITRYSSKGDGVRAKSFGIARIAQRRITSETNSVILNYLCTVLEQRAWMATNERTVKSVHRAFDIVEGLRELDGAGVTELAEHIDLPASTVHNYLSTLRERCYVVKDDNNYRLAARFVHVGDYIKQQQELFRVGRRNVRWLAEETGETVNLVIEEFGRIIYLISEVGSEGLSNYSYVRRREYLHSTAAGKAVLMELDEDRRRQILDRHGLPAQTSSTITDRNRLLDELEDAREHGYTFNDEENTEGIRAVGASVECADGSYGAVSLSGPLNHLPDERFREELPALVHDTARSIEIELVS